MPIELKPHNQIPYEKVKENLRTGTKVAIVHPTGTGKSYIALKLIEDNKNKKTVYIAPSNAILHGIKNNIFESGLDMADFPNLKRITYQKLMNLTDDEIKKLKCDYIILDEFHHCGAPEWGNGVNRLLERNPNVKILGLSATPIRYFDNLRDMSDEIFEGNVASEMTLEEAIEKGILPEATYVSTLHGYSEELENMENNIKNMSNGVKKKQAQELFSELRKKLDENTQNLSELLSTHMKNKNGKYIVFCKNIEDMKEKVSKANKMFGDVNENMNIYSVSSENDLRKNERILTKFEKDDSEDTLKLMYAVDMLNEGYHIKGLDGVVMMRPTRSPTTFSQQLGRALSVGNDNVPVILDLVNNFDNCKIIEDFCDKMKKYSNSSNNDKEKAEEKSRLAIFDTTKEFREIAQKITSLTKSKININEKIEILERFFNSGEELKGNTIFEGYPIGGWANQIRSQVKRSNEGENVGLVLSETQLKRLEDMGLLEAQRENISERIKTLLNWKEEHPDLNPTTSSVPSELYDGRDKNWRKIEAEYNKIYKDYKYVKAKYKLGKLTEEQITSCKEARVGGIFGYPKKIEEIAKEYKQEEYGVDKIVAKYGTMENFIKLYQKEGNTYYDTKYDAYRFNIKFRNYIDVDLNKNSDCYINLLRDIFGETPNNEILFYSSKEIDKLIDDERIVEKYGLKDGRPKTNAEVGEKFHVSGSYIGSYINRRFPKLRHPSRKNKIIRRIPKFSDFELNILTEEEKEDYKKIKDELYTKTFLMPSDKYEQKDLNDTDKEKINEFLKYSDNIKNRIKRKSLEKKLKNYQDEQNITAYVEWMVDKYEKVRKLEQEGIETTLASTRTCNALRNASIRTLGDLLRLDESRLPKIRNIGGKTVEELKTIKDNIYVCEVKGFPYKKYCDIMQNMESTEDIEFNTGNIKIEELNLSDKTLNALKKSNYRNVFDILYSSPNNEFDEEINKDLDESLQTLGIQVPENKDRILYDESTMTVKKAREVFELESKNSLELLSELKNKGIDNLPYLDEIKMSKAENLEDFNKWKEEKIKELKEQINLLDKETKNTDKSDSREKTENIEFSELRDLKNKKGRLEKYTREQEVKIKEAKDLFLSYDNLSKKDKENSESEKNISDD